MIDEWKAAIKKEPTQRLFREVTQAFKAAVATTKGEGVGQCRYKVADSSGKTPPINLPPKKKIKNCIISGPSSAFPLFYYDM